MNDATSTACSSCFKDIDPRATRCPFCTQRQPHAPGLSRDVPGRLVGGVAAALSLHLGWDVTLVRVLFVASLAVTGGMSLWGYGLLWVLTPFEAQGRSPAVRVMDWIGRLFAPPSGSRSGEPPLAG
jgi:phage shock protein PspC (stress-responsive transcriptional regulator)